MDKLMSVQVRQGHIRKKPSFLGTIVKRLHYGEKVIVLKEKDNWAKVKSPGTGTIGFMHISALTTRKIVFNPGKKQVQKAATSDEFALAGKGFNENVESRFRADNPYLNFTGIDRMEGYGVSEEQIKQFIFKGQLKPRGET